MGAGIRRALMVVALVALVMPAPASADTVPRFADRVERVAAGLAEAPVFVDPEVRHLVTEEEIEAVTAEVESAAYPVFVIAQPVSLFDPAHRGEDYYLHAVYEELGEPGVFVLARPPEAGTTSGFSLSPAPFVAEVPVEPWLAADHDRADPEHGDLLRAPVRDALDAIDEADEVPESLATPPEPPEAPDSPVEDAESDGDTAEDGGDSGRVFTAGAGGLVLGVLGGALVVLVLRAVVDLVRRARPPTRDESALPPLLHARSAPTEPSVAWLSTTLAREVQALREAHARRTPDEPGYSEMAAALDAVTLIDGERAHHHPHWLVGAIVLARVTRATPESPGRLRWEQAAPCMVNPLHGAAIPGGLAGLVTPESAAQGKVCARCQAIPLRQRVDRVLKLPSVDDPGARVPHADLPGPWAGTQYGALDESLATTVLEKLDAR